MFLERLSGTLVSVPEIVTDPKYDGEHVAVHGLLYAGRHSQGQFLCLPKEGPFNGIFEGVRAIPHRESVLVVRDPDLTSKFEHIPKACGDFMHQYDAIIVGRVSRERFLEYDVALSDLWLMVLQSVVPMPKHPYHCDFHVLNFAKDSVPRARWAGLREPTNVPILEAEPFV